MNPPILSMFDGTFSLDGNDMLASEVFSFKLRQHAVVISNEINPNEINPFIISKKNAIHLSQCQNST